MTLTGIACIVFIEVLLVTVANCVIHTQPEQVHLALTGKDGEMMVTWVTLNATDTPIVEYGIDKLTHYAKGNTDEFVDGGSEQRKLYIHRVKLTKLIATKTYMYHVGSPLGWSDLFFFKAAKDDPNVSLEFAVFGDMGNKNARSLARLQEEAQRGRYDAILHVGDFAYDMDTDNARVGDEFMNQIQSVAAYTPYMTSVGNHEHQYNFSNYKNRFSMPGGDGQGMFYSFNLGPAHFIMFSSEFYYFVQYGYQQIHNQFKWLEDDLIEANKAENRAKHPWIISMCHRPLYCSNSNDIQHCTNMENTIRVGMSKYHNLSPEQLIYKYGVDLNIQAHEHSYERMWPVYNLTVCNGSSSNPYHNAKAPVHIVTGSAGCQELVDPFVPFPSPWSAYHSDDYGYMRMHIINSTHLHLEQVSDVKGGAIIDEITMVKDQPMPKFDCSPRG